MSRFLSWLALGVAAVFLVVPTVSFSSAATAAPVLGASLAIGGLAVVGLTGHEVSVERAARSAKDATSECEGRLAAAA